MDGLCFGQSLYQIQNGKYAMLLEFIGFLANEFTDDIRSNVH